MRAMLLVSALGLAGCGGHDSSKAVGNTHPTPPPDTRSQLEIRRDAACEELGPRITACAIADAKATMTPKELAELDLEKTAAKNTEEFIAECESHQLSSRQVRVYEVCLKEETECEPLLACLEHVNDKEDGAAAP